jgi:proteic killer suppression protein
MIVTINHRGLRKLWEKDDGSLIPAGQVQKIRRILFALDSATSIKPLKAIPGYRLHLLSGNLKGFWSITVNGNYRIIFKV